ncbi:two-component system sensor histidine kinase NtrB [Halorubrum kocurii]|uniref:histidine kinase n=1 Tax=Halorubrum kocurii JCM 14978 TaxID=1230456 RepID=M0NVI1_9EURY|nr:PAS domain S-box protein [Halorubrum kocurii]EMA61553.1 PAS/PAC sensor signal transduction histidine kinase [Halorubrum kocurii JCM 14978]
MTDGSPRDREVRRYETVLDSLDDAVYAVRPDGTIAYVNGRYAEMKGVSREELLGTDIYDWVTEETAAEAKRARRELASDDREAGTVEYEFLTADGERFPVEMRFTRLTGEKGDELDRVGVIRDVRERKRREEALRRKNERLEEFASIVSHDLRNPLNVAQGRLGLAREEHDSEHLEAVARSHERMETLIDDLLTLARDGEAVEETEWVPLHEVAEACWEGVETASCSLRIETDRAIRADRSRLKQIFENLMRNSVEHGRSGDNGPTERADGAVTVTVGAVDGGFYLADDGPGIPESDREAVFETGYSTSEGGTGFGLEIVQAVAAAHDWTVRVTDAADGGARFEFTGVDVRD